MSEDKNIFNTDTLAGALAANENDELQKWVHDFLNKPKGNTHLSKHILEKQHQCLGLHELPLGELERICGPEDSMKYFEPREQFENTIEKMMNKISDGWEPQPLIVGDIWSDSLSIADGNHRHEALKRLELQQYWSIVYLKPNSDREKYNL